MQEIIRLIDVSLYNETHYGLTFTVNWSDNPTDKTVEIVELFY